MQKKKIILISLLSLLAVVIIVMVFLVFNDKKGNNEKEMLPFQPTFLSDQEKKQYGLSPDIKAQSFYDEEGNLIYKIINSDDDLVLNVDEI